MSWASHEAHTLPGPATKEIDGDRWYGGTSHMGGHKTTGPAWCSSAPAARGECANSVLLTLRFKIL